MTDERVVVISGDEQIDVTEAVRTMYDLLHDSMNWGSRFLSIEDVIEVTRLAAVCGFIGLDGAAEQMTAYIESLFGQCALCGFRGTFVLGEVTEHGRIVRIKGHGHQAILVQPRNEPAYLQWPEPIWSRPIGGA